LSRDIKLKKRILIFILIVVVFALFFFLLINRGPNRVAVENNQQGLISHTVSVTNTQIVVTNTPTVSLTSTSTLVPTSTATPDYNQIEFLFFDALYGVSSKFELEMNGLIGDYYASGRINNGSIIAYKCDFRTDKPTQLVCESGPLPFNTKINLQLYQESSDKLAFSQQINYNFASHGETIPSPTGVICEGEPQWNGFTSAHQLEKGCFAMSCWQNGDYLWGTDNTCRDPWPFLWLYSHPLNVPTP
jgi:hypothetical protein